MLKENKEDVMAELKNHQKHRSIDTAKLIEISRQVLRVARRLQEEDKKPTKPLTPYEECVKTNPYLSKYDIISYR